MGTNRRRTRRARRNRARRNDGVDGVVIRDSAEFERILDSQAEGGPPPAFATAAEQTWLDIVAERPNLRDAVAWNKTTTASVLTVLAQDPEERIRGVIARTRRISLDVFRILARDPSENVRAALVDHPKLPDEIRGILLRDASPWVRQSIAQAGWGSEPVDQ